MIEIPKQLQQVYIAGRNYKDYGMMIEQYAHQQWCARPPSGIHRQYVPIYWTSLYSAKNRKLVGEAQRIIDSIEGPSFTVVQHDEGLCRNTAPDDMRVFTAGCDGPDVLPLIYDLEVTDAPCHREQFAFFAGNITHKANDRNRVRSRMRDALQNAHGFSIMDTGQQPLVDFSKSMRECVFALCPRGYGPTSFRLYEAMHYGAIPVYIYDKPCLPYLDELRWPSFSVLCHIDDIRRLPARLRSFSRQGIAQLQQEAARLLPKYFTMPAVYRQLVLKLQREEDGKA